ncbi:PREDICTED: cytochrome P450 94C1-like [Tarenaya hassleriana]|uniref:cytochrome P450 94C1-like n=1 Tax=Tarenaya hassleriana TaxID=28532 RepID=UPI00053CA25F|nr:PREDICTED: cytochrome P450 94C1-like [Tarenaya hassleriana]
MDLALFFSSVFFSFTFIFSLFSLSICISRLNLWCTCEICDTFVSGRWRRRFDNLSDWYTDLLRRSATTTVHVHVINNTVTANPMNVEHILKTNFDNYPKGKPFSAILGDLLGRGIFNVDGDSWRFQKKLASLELGSASTRSFAFDVVTFEIRQRLLPLLTSVSGRSDSVLDLQDILRRFTFDTICKFSFGLDPGCLRLPLPVSEFATAFDAASRLSAGRALVAVPLVWKIKRLLNIGSEKKLRESIQLVNRLAEELISERREKGFSDKHDLLSRFMGAINDDKYLRDIVISFILAGRDTVASALTSFFWLLTQNPTAESSIRLELDQVMGPGPDPVTATYDQTREMHYLHAALHESMRLYPPVQFDSKFSLDDDVLTDGTFVKKGTKVTYHPYAMGRMDMIWGPDCDEFRPERWLKDGKFSSENPFKYPVFQAGLRVCLGKEMSLVEMKCVAIALIRRFRIRVADPGWIPIFEAGLTATVRGGLPVLIEEREVTQHHH